MTYKSDEEIQIEALFQLDWDSRLKQSDIGVTIKKGVVTLTGTVDSYAKKLAAQKAAHRVPGVLDVANDIQVKVTGSLRRTDSVDRRFTSLEENSVSVAFSTSSRRCAGAALSRTSLISCGVFTGAFISSSLLVGIRRRQLAETGAGGG